MYHGTYNDDVVDHIAKVLKMVDLIYVPGMDSYQLRMKVFPLSLADEAKEWWISEGDEKIPLGRNLLRNSFIDSINKRYVDNNISSNNEWMESKYENPSNTATDSFFRAYDVHNIERDNGQGQIKHKNNDKDDMRPHKKICTTKKFEAIKYSLRPNEEYLAIRRCEYDIWERNKDSVSQTYHGIFQKKDNG
ncbi:hypothetical protein Tco_1031731 [Tanacetum coccineum]|uniref:Uncharacterized protein n=1 Tax=Tanacetum coccineum TaxID=301880 RepID=A0ABQ5GAB9_9ASTR